jgi:hypothetical protein
LTQEQRQDYEVNTFFSKLCWNRWTSTYKKMNADTDLTPVSEISLKWITVLNVKYKTIKFPEENQINFRYGNDFLNITPRYNL